MLHEAVARSSIPLLSAALLVSSWGGAPAAREQDPAPPPLPWMVERETLAPIESPAIALAGGTIMTATGRIIEDGVLVMEDGLIVAVGARDEVEVPSGAEIVGVRRSAASSAGPAGSSTSAARRPPKRSSTTPPRSA